MSQTTALIDSGVLTTEQAQPSIDTANALAALIDAEATSTAVDGIEPEESINPTSFSLDQNYPNPFNPTTTISCDLPEAADVTLNLVDLLGRTVRQLASGTQPAGTYEVSFDAAGLPSGVYFYRLQAGDYVETRRMVIVK